jgi:hypothetical protein
MISPGRAPGGARPSYDGFSPSRRFIVQLRTLSAAALTVACLVLGGCREHNEPVKPITDLSANTVSVSVSTPAP